MNKKIKLFFACLLLVLSFTGCKQDIAEEGKVIKDEVSTVYEANGEKIMVLSTIFPMYDFTREVAGDRVDVDVLVKPGSDIHYFEPSPQDLVRIQESDLFIYVGGPDDEWVETALENMEEGPEVIKLTDLVEIYEEEIVEGMEHTHDHDHNHEETHDHDHEHNHEEGHDHDHEHEIDEHVWVSLRNAKVIAKEIEKKLSQLDNDNAETYEDNLAKYIEKLDGLDKKFVDLFGKKDIVLLVADRFPFRYFVEDYGLEYYAAFTGCSANSDPSAKTVSFLIDKTKELGLGTIYHIESSNGELANSIGEATGAKVKELHSCHNLSFDEFNEGVSYLELMEGNYKTLKED